MLPPSGDTIQMLEALDLSIRTRSLLVGVDWFRAFHCTDVPNHTWHEHSNMEIHFLLSGSLRFHLPDRSIDLLGGQALVVSPGVMHQLENRSGKEYYRFVIKLSVESLVDDPEASFLLTALTVPDVQVISIYGCIAGILENCLEEAIERVNGFMTAIEVNIVALLIAVARELTHSAKATYPAREKRNPDQQRVQQLVGLLGRESTAVPTVEELASAMYLSPRQLQRVVQKQTGMTLRDMIGRARLKRAKELLKFPGANIADVATQTGFSNSQSFSRFFHKMEGESPTSYRLSAVSARGYREAHKAQDG